MRPAKRLATMTQIAESAGVSVPTVSKVLNQHPDVAPATRERVEQLLVEHGYALKKKSLARTMKKTSSGLVNFVVPELYDDYIMAIMRGVEDVLQPLDMHFIVCSTRGDLNRERQWLQNVGDGVIIVLTENQAVLQELRQHNIPFVVVDRLGELDLDTPSVGAMNWSGGRAATQYLLSLGHRRIAIITGNPCASSNDRLAGYRAALEEVGIPIDPVLIRQGNFSSESGYKETCKLLQLSQPPTAIFANNDFEALGIYRALYQHNVAIPEQISVVGFDDIPVAAELVPPLSTMRQPLFEMGRVAANMLIRLITEEPIDSIRVELATPLIKRGSCAPPATT